MANYLYNGRELPALPEWDKTTCPYCTIIEEHLLGGGTRTVCYVSDAPLAQIDENTNNLGSSMGDGNTAPDTYILMYWLEGDEWVYKYYYSFAIFTLLVDTIIYTNYNLYVFQTDTLVLAASAPVPVGETPKAYSSYVHNGTWQKGTFYNRVNNAWVKHQAYKRQNGAWVKVKE